MNKSQAYLALKSVLERLPEHSSERNTLNCVIEGYFYESSVKPSNLLKEAVKTLKKLPNNLKTVHDKDYWPYIFEVNNNIAKFSNELYYFSFPVCNLENGWYDKNLQKREEFANCRSADTYLNYFEVFFSSERIADIGIFTGKLINTALAVQDVEVEAGKCFRLDTKLLVMFQKILLTHKPLSGAYANLRTNTSKDKYTTFAYSNAEDVTLIAISRIGSNN